MLKQVISDFDDIVVEINMATHKVVQIRFQSSYNFDIFDLHAENNFFTVETVQSYKFVSFALSVFDTR